MGAASVTEQARLGRLMAVSAWHAFHRRLTYYAVSWDAFSAFDRAELTLVPQDIRTADPTIADDIYEGRFTFAGEVIVERNDSPFAIIPPSAAWAEELHSFAWLRHLRASDKALAQVNAQALVLDWIEETRLTSHYAWQPLVLANRILAWISQSPLILADCNRTFYNKFVRSLCRQVRYLRRSANNAPDGLARIKASIALAAASIAISNQGRFKRQSLRRLDQEIQRQILPDGGHFSRNPAPLIEILLDLIPLRQTILAAQLAPSQTVMNAIDRMMPMIRFFQLGDGAFARFNGMGATPVDLVAAILAHDDSRGRPPYNASHSGYQRMQAGDTVIIQDTGTPPPVSVSSEAHAGCLSFEMSSGNRPIIVNCGIPNRQQATLRRLARTTAAHSTLSIGNASSCRFARLTRYTAVHGIPILSGPSVLNVTREDTGGTTFVSATHDGYKRSAGYLHERSLTLREGGMVIEGIDSLARSSSKQPETGHEFAIRFHLHPFVKPGPVGSGGTVRLSVRGGQIWQFAAPGCDIAIEESVYLSEMVGSLPTQQIVILGRSDTRPTVSWRLERTEEQELLGDFADLAPETGEDGAAGVDGEGLEGDGIDAEPADPGVPAAEDLTAGPAEAADELAAGEDGEAETPAAGKADQMAADDEPAWSEPPEVAAAPDRDEAGEPTPSEEDRDSDIPRER